MRSYRDRDILLRTPDSMPWFGRIVRRLAKDRGTSAAAVVREAACAQLAREDEEFREHWEAFRKTSEA